MSTKTGSTRVVSIPEIRPKIVKALENIRAERVLAWHDQVLKFSNWYAEERQKWWRVGPFALKQLLTFDDVNAFLMTADGSEFANGYGFRTYQNIHEWRWNGAGWSESSEDKLVELLTLIDIAQNEPNIILTVRDAGTIAKFSVWSGQVGVRGEWPA